MSVFVVLGLLWAAVLIPPMLRARAERKAEFIDSFRRQMGALGQKAVAGRRMRIDTTHGLPAMLRTGWGRPTSPAKRRRDILGGLLGAMIGSFVLGLIPALRSVWILLLVFLNLFIAYVALLAHNRRSARTARRAQAVAPPERVYAPALDASH